MVLATSLSKAAARRRLILGSGGGGGAASSSSSASASASASCQHSIPSFGFSGAGFLTCYHLGVTDCLLKNGKLLERFCLPNEDSPILTGVSGGALAAAAVAVGISPEDGMNAIDEIARRTRNVGGIMDHLRPGFSLIDQVEDLLLQLTREVDDEFVLRRIRSYHQQQRHQDGIRRLLRIGLTDSSYFPQFHIPESYIYVDDFESVDEIVASCILSSYVPGLTGPAISSSSSPNNTTRNGAVRRATRHLNKMLQRGSIKDRNGIPTYSLEHPTNGKFWDGGLANVFPIIDSNTTLVTPFAGKFNNSSISPSPTTSSISSSRQQSSSHHREDSGGIFRWWKLRRRMSSSLSKKTMPKNHHHMNNAQLDLSFQNVNAFRCIAFSSDYEILESWFEDGYNDALKYLKATGHETSSVASFSSIPTPSASVTTKGNNNAVLSSLSHHCHARTTAEELQSKPQSSSAEIVAQ